MDLETRAKISVKKMNNRIKKEIPLFFEYAKTNIDEQKLRLSKIDADAKVYSKRIHKFQEEQYQKARIMEEIAFSMYPEKAKESKKFSVIYRWGFDPREKSEYFADFWFCFLRENMAFCDRDLADMFCSGLPHQEMEICPCCGSKNKNPQYKYKIVSFIIEQKSFFGESHEENSTQGS